MSTEPTSNQPTRSAIVYVDGFNLFYGALEGTSLKWLDLVALFTKLFKQDNVFRIKFFTSMVYGPEKRRRQQVYLDALEATGVEIIKGLHQEKDVACRYSRCSASGVRLFQVIEEKRTDVNIAINLVLDAVRKRCTHQVLVTADSDLCPAVEEAIKEGSVVSLVIPTKSGKLEHYARELRGSAKQRAIAFPSDVAEQCQLPNPVVRNEPLKPIRKPDGW